MGTDSTAKYKLELVGNSRFTGNLFFRTAFAPDRDAAFVAAKEMAGGDSAEFSTRGAPGESHEIGYSGTDERGNTVRVCIYELADVEEGA